MADVYIDGVRYVPAHEQAPQDVLETVYRWIASEYYSLADGPGWREDFHKKLDSCTILVTERGHRDDTHIFEQMEELEVLLSKGKADG